MFEKEAKEYSTSSKIDYVNNISITLVQQAFKDGSEFGYNEAKKGFQSEIEYAEKHCLFSDCTQIENLKKAKEIIADLLQLIPPAIRRLPTKTKVKAEQFLKE